MHDGWVDHGQSVRAAPGGIGMRCMPVVLQGVYGIRGTFLAIKPDDGAAFERVRALLRPVPLRDLELAVAAGDPVSAAAAMIGDGRVWLTAGGCVQLQLPEVEPVCVVNVYGEDYGHGWDWDVLSTGTVRIAVFDASGDAWFSELPAEMDDAPGGVYAPCGRQCVTTAAEDGGQG